MKKAPQHIAFLHIPKAGGMTLRHILKRQYEADAVFEIGEDINGDIERFRTAPVTERHRTKLLMGHMTYGLHRFLPGAVTCLTMLRDPVSRVYSEYRFLSSNENHPLYSTIAPLTYHQYLELDPTRQAGNGQTRLLSGSTYRNRIGVPGIEPMNETHLNRALDHLKRDYPLVGLLERFDETLMLWQEQCNWGYPFYEIKNISKRPPRALDDSEIEHTRSKNRFDLVLYQEALELFDANLKKQSNSFHRRLKTFTLLNKTYRQSRRHGRKSKTRTTDSTRKELAQLDECSMANFYWKIETNIPSEIETGVWAVIPIKGYGFFLDGATREISLWLDGAKVQNLSIHEPRHDVFQSIATLDRKGYSQISGFWGLLKIPQSLAGKHLDLELEAIREDGRRFRTIVGSVQIVRQRTVEKVPVGKGAGNMPLVAICMTTYNPGAAPFKRQIQSIINQTYSNWICIVNDDGSDSEHFKTISKVCAKDSRFFLFRNEANLGFYRNFEMALKRSPDDAEYIAMADQDDEWYPEKIERCVGRFDPDTQLVYSDMRIVTNDGWVLSDTYWVNRKNNYRDMDVILMANTVTGAASVFRRSLVEKIIPFPEPIGEAYHDNWIALNALMEGSIEYVDEPLYSYIQYHGQVIGHCDFGLLTVKRRFMRLRTYASAYTRVFGKKMIQTGLDLQSVKRNLMLIKDYFLMEGRKNYRLLQAVYLLEYRRLQLFSETLTARTQPKTDTQRFALSLFTGNVASVGKLVRAHIKVRRNRDTTNDAELRLMLSYVAHKISKKTAWRSRERNVALYLRQTRDSELGMQHQIRFLVRKTAPLKIKMDPAATRQINILIPTIDMNILFGGYIGKLNLARRFAACGYSVRIIIVDKCDFVPVDMDGLLSDASPLAAEYSKITFQYCFDRDHEVVMNPDDIVVASTWWTAHIAHAAVRKLHADHFIYFIQEYESFTFPMGTYAALADESYGFPHFPLFSSKLLKEYFELNQLGAYADEKGKDSEKTAIFENAITMFGLTSKTFPRRTYKRVLFYARPEAHASRNMFETGVLALKAAVKKEIFDDSWELWGAGSVSGEIPLGKGQRLKMIGKLSLEAYQQTLPEFDLGLSLMYTPHPSLVPIEMAAAGMVVITTNCLNKTAEKMASISPNILGVDASVEAITEGLRTAVKQCEDIEGRLAGTNVNWPKSWKESLPSELIHTMVGWFD